MTCEHETPWKTYPKVYTTLQMEAALCVWECLTEMRFAIVVGRTDSTWAMPSALVPELINPQHGTVTTRLEVVPSIAEMVLDLYEHAEVRESVRERAGWSYDWDFVPWVIQQVTGTRHCEKTNTTIAVFPPFEEMVEAILLETGDPRAEMDAGLYDGDEAVKYEQVNRDGGRFAK